VLLLLLLQRLLDQCQAYMAARLASFKANEVAVSLWALARLRGQPELRLMGAALQHCFSQVGIHAAVWVCAFRMWWLRRVLSQVLLCRVVFRVALRSCLVKLLCPGLRKLARRAYAPFASASVVL
jgi:hypothetical protein